MIPRAVDVGLVEAVHNAITQAIAQASETAGFLCHFFLRESTGFAEADDTRNIERAGAHAALVAAAVNAGGNLHARIFAAHIQSADALGPIHFVTRDRHDVNVLLDHVHRNFANGLGRVGVKDHAALVTKLADF